MMMIVIIVNNDNNDDDDDDTVMMMVTMTSAYGAATRCLYLWRAACTNAMQPCYMTTSVQYDEDKIILLMILTSLVILTVCYGAATRCLIPLESCRHQ